MPNSLKNAARRRPTRYQIKIEGKIRADWSDWLCGMDISAEKVGGEFQTTTLDGIIPDQAALRGILCKIWDLNLTIISVNRIGVDGIDEEGEK